MHVPNLSSISVVPTEAHIDNPQLHDGRLRSFPHTRGNWASFVYIKYPKEEILQNLIDKIQTEINKELKESCVRCGDFHISLSKTVVLHYHLITPFTKSLQESLGEIEWFDLEFSNIKVYCNDDKTRTFIALEVDYFAKKHLLQLSQKVDEVLEEFNLPLFYENPSFHVSIFWVNGNKEAELLALSDKLNALAVEEIGDSVVAVSINTINCKIGNKFYQFSLQ